MLGYVDDPKAQQMLYELNVSADSHSDFTLQKGVLI